MYADLTPLFPLIAPFLLVAFRMLGLFAFVPFLSNSSIPGNVKVLLGIAITFCIWNVLPKIVLPAACETLPGLVIAIAGEMSVGLVIGMLMAAVLAGIQLGSHLISQQMGLSLATIYDPSFEDQSTVIEQVAFWIALTAFLAMGGHRQLINVVVYSYHTVPVGSGGLSPELMLNAVIGAMNTSFHAAAQIGMPALAAFFIATITSGLVSRSMPQLNMMSLGITLNLMVGFIMVGVGLTGWALVSQRSFEGLFRDLARVVGG